MTGSILERVCKADNLPSLPTVAVEILRLTKDEGASVDDLAGVIQQDPALTGRILKVVNSSLFGIPREIASVNQAVGLLGLRTVKVMTLSFSLVDTVRSSQGEGFDFEAFWRRSLSSAVAARLLGRAVAPRLAEEAFVAGLLSDLGMVAAWRCAADAYHPVLAARARRDRHPSEIEADLLGVTHARMSRELLRTWGLPGSLCDAVGAHHGEGLAALSGPALELASVVHSAATVADLFCGEIPFAELDHVKTQCIEETGIDETRLEEVLAALDTHVRKAASMLSVLVGETVDYAQLQVAAASQLAQLSMQAELERMESSKKEQVARLEADRLHVERKAILEVATTDGLTKVANRAAFDKRLEEELRRARQQVKPLGLILMDVDQFKRFNDTHGHQAGDQVLRTIGRCLQDVVREAGFVARYGGEEFAVILADQTSDQIRTLAEEIRGAIASTPARHNECELRVTASLGATCVAGGSASLTGAQLIEEADQQLYQAKRNGRDRVEMRG